MIAVNQVGYVSKDVKHVTVNRSGKYKLYRADGTFIREFPVDSLVPDENSGENIALIDFSDLTEVGEYAFRDENGEESCRFRIAKDAKELYYPLITDSVRMFYFQRCGMDLEEKYAGKFKHRACHCQEASYLDNPAKKKKTDRGMA